MLTVLKGKKGGPSVGLGVKSNPDHMVAFQLTSFQKNTIIK
jgi:hypothetical protein